MAILLGVYVQCLESSSIPLKKCTTSWTESDKTSCQTLSRFSINSVLNILTEILLILKTLSGVKSKSYLTLSTLWMNVQTDDKLSEEP